MRKIEIIIPFPIDDWEYLLAKREHWLILNLVDVENPAFIANEILRKFW